MVAEHRSPRKTWFDWLTLSLGRLLGYMAYAVLAWLLGKLVTQSRSTDIFLALAETGMGGWLAYYGFAPMQSCAGGICSPVWPPFAARLSSSSIVVFGLGFLAGLTPCPPFLMITIRTVRQKDLIDSIAMFTLFYFGTLLWFVPWPFIGMLGRFAKARQIAKFVAGLAGVGYCLWGIIQLVGTLVYG